jgi:hypothetical protein
MPRYLIELTHDDEYAACVRALEAIEQLGSHFVTRAEWGCADGTHAGWLIAEVDSRQEALQLVPAEFRHEARIVQLNRFTREQIASMVADLEEPREERRLPRAM